MDTIQAQVAKAAEALCDAANLATGSIVVVGCSSSEVIGEGIGTHSSPEVAREIVDGILSVLTPRGIYLAAQCCEHLNRALIVEAEAVPYAERVNVLPQPKAGGSFATAAYASFKNPIAIEHIRADAGLDIGGTLIGMHLREVAVPLRLPIRSIGAAPLTAARVRPKFIGGSRAVYDEALL